VATRCKVLPDRSSSKKSVTPRRVEPATQAGRWRELGGVSMVALGAADEVAEQRLGGAATSTCARRTNGEAVSYGGSQHRGVRRRLPWRGGSGIWTGLVRTVVSLKTCGAYKGRPIAATPPFLFPLVLPHKRAPEHSVAPSSLSSAL
jgi:hypothetical protein